MLYLFSPHLVSSLLPFQAPRCFICFLLIWFLRCCLFFLFLCFLFCFLLIWFLRCCLFFLFFFHPPFQLVFTEFFTCLSIWYSSSIRHVACNRYPSNGCNDGLWYSPCCES